MLELAVAVVVLLTAVALAAYVTFLYARRIGSGDKGLKSFLVWIRDVIDVALGL